MLSVIGYSVFFVLFFGTLHAQARRWRMLAASYGGVAGPPRDKRSMQSAVLLGIGGYNSLKGILTIGVHDEGVSLRVLPPFSLFHDPLFIPYGDIRGWRTTWYLDAPSVELEFDGVPGIKMVVPADQAEFIGSSAGRKMALSAAEPPQGKAGQGARAFALVHAWLSLVMLASLLFVWLTQ
mgnify:CR=1 FL=1